MSEPASLVVQCRIAPDDLGRCLAAREPRASGWPDWAGLDVTLAAHEIADLDLRTGASTGDFLRRMRASAERPADWLCAYDAPDQTLTIGQTLFSDNWLTIVAVLAVLRRLGNFIAPGQAPGMILVQDWIFGQRGTLAAVTLFPGGSAILAPESLDWDVDGFTARILSPLRDAVVAARPGPARDDLDLLIGRN